MMHVTQDFVGHAMKVHQIVIEFIPQQEQKYDTCGNYQLADGVLSIQVSQTKDERHQQLVAIHELVEALLCVHDGVSFAAIDHFDIHGYGATLDEPGNDPSAPYHRQHLAATAVEACTAAVMGVSWPEYEAAVSDTGVRE